MTDRAAFLNSLVGRPYEPAGFHCWAFVAAVEAELFGRRGLPVFAEKPTDAEIVQQFRSHPERRNWREVETPADGSIALMRRAVGDGAVLHCGVYLITDGLGAIWHCDDPQGVEFVSPVELTEMRRWSLRYFEPAA